ncbi:MAG: hypothetical protein ACRBF0_13735 [Calditrichia bacterium]
MQELLTNSNLAYLILAAFLLLLVSQVYLLLRIRNVLQALSMNFDSTNYFVRKLVNRPAAPEKKAPANQDCKTCQFCKHRLAYINTGKTTSEDEDFYHVCALKNMHISLADSCENFEEEVTGLAE